MLEPRKTSINKEGDLDEIPDRYLPNLASLSGYTLPQQKIFVASAGISMRMPGYTCK
jgi:hypothetical protein